MNFKVWICSPSLTDLLRLFIWRGRQSDSSIWWRRPWDPPLNQAGGDIITLTWSPNRLQRAERTNQSRWISLLPSLNAHRMTSLGTKYRRKSICCPFATYSLLILVKANITVIILLIIVIIHTLKFDAIAPTGCCQHI